MRIRFPVVAALALLASSVSASAQRDLTPAEMAAVDQANQALDRQDYASARGLLAAPALAQVPQVHFALFQLYEEGLGGSKDPAAATEALRRAAGLGDLQSMMYLGERLDTSDASPATLAEAKSWFIAAGNQGVAHAWGHIGRMQLEAGDLPAAVASFQKGAEGDTLALAGLALAYASGQGVPADEVKANYLYHKLAGTPPSEGYLMVDAVAKAGQPYAQYIMGLWLSDPNSQLYKPADAVEYLGAAAEAGHLRAAERLAEMLDKGQGVPRDAAGAYRAYAKAVELDPENYLAGRMGEMALAGDGTTKNVAEAVRLFKLGPYGSNHPYQLGLIYAGAEGWPRDLGKAVEEMDRVFDDKEQPLALAWLKAQADAGNAEAQYAYAGKIKFKSADRDASGRELTYEQRQAAEEANRNEARRYYERAAAQNLPKAMIQLAQESSVDDAARLRLMRAAVDAGSGWAMLEMSRWHSLGWTGLAKDEVMARSYDERAARTGDPDVLGALGSNYGIAGAVLTGFRHEAGVNEKITENYRLSARYYEAAQVAGNENAAEQLGNLYSDKSSGIANPQLALKWYLAAANRPSPSDAVMEKLSGLYEAGSGTPVDLTRAWFWARVQGRFGTGKGQERANALWPRLTPAQQQIGENALITCELSSWKVCTI